MDLHCECKGAMEVLHRRGQGQALGLLCVCVGVAREAWSERKRLEPGKGLRSRTQGDGPREEAEGLSGWRGRAVEYCPVSLAGVTGERASSPGRVE